MNDDPDSATAKLAAFAADKVLLIAIVIAVAAAAWMATSAAAEKAVQLPAPAFDPPAAGQRTQTAVLAGGCFWGVQLVFQHTRGVLNAVSGYAGGSRESANYQTVASGATDHAESVQVTFDPAQISFGKLLQIYFSVAHDPTQLNRQGPDHGPQYRSAIFYREPGQKEVAERYIAQLEVAKPFPRKIVTQLAPLHEFHPAEAYHQDYATRHPESPYIIAFDRPKIDSLKSVMPEVYRDKPVLVTAR